MSDFFEPPTPPRPPERYRQPPWVAPPPGTLPGILAVELVLAQTDKVAVYISRVAAYPTGFEFDLITIAAPGEEETELLDPMLFGPRHRARRSSQDPTSEMLRIGVQFADGGKATNTSGFYHGGDSPAGPVMHAGGGGGSNGRWYQTMWVWPLPPPGRMAFVCDWRAAGIPLTRHELAAETILDAADRARVIFSDENLPDQPGGTWTTTHLAAPQVRADPPADAE
jgi:hypothetical protein